MLKQRVITAVVLLALLLPALLASAVWPFALLTLVAIGVAGWEWGRLNHAGDAESLAWAAALVAACGLTLANGWSSQGPTSAWWLATLGWVMGGAWVLRLGPACWPQVPQAVRRILGVVALWAAWLALASAKAEGLNFLLSVLCLVWTADTAAYFGGRTFGRRKLAPAISPGKTWEGVWSGMLGVVVLALVWMLVERQFAVDSPSLYVQLSQRLGSVGLVIALLFLASMSVVGDLLESLVKRSAGVKDSSRLLPGHGGVLDRIDALLPVFPLAMALRSF
jgi:phosphatidate cytidylyltransferase